MNSKEKLFKELKELNIRRHEEDLYCNKMLPSVDISEDGKIPAWVLVQETLEKISNQIDKVERLDKRIAEIYNELPTLSNK